MVSALVHCARSDSRVGGGLHVAFSLKEGRLSWVGGAAVFAPVGVERVAHFSFGAWGADCSWELPRLLNSMRGRQAARKQLELAEASVPLAWERAGLKGCWRLRMCQQAVSTLRATADFAGFLPARLTSSL
jgi:hypothetical protein